MPRDRARHAFGVMRVQGCLAHKKLPHPRTLQYAYASGPMAVLGGLPVGVNPVMAISRFEHEPS